MNERSRDTTIDLAKGIAIIAIVLGHVLRGLSSAGQIDAHSGAFRSVDQFLYAFHLTVFAFLAALFVRRAVEREGTRKYLRSRDATFIYLYLLWSALQGGVKLLTSALVSSPTSIQDILALWKPEGQLWFLPWLVVMTTVVGVTRPWRTRASLLIAISLSTALSLASWGISGPIAGTQGLGLAVFFVCGAVIGFDRFSAIIRAIALPVWWLIALAGWAALVLLSMLTDATPPTINGDSRNLFTVLLGVAGSLAGFFGVIAVARLISVLRNLTVGLSFIGERTLEIFLAHIIAGSGMRIILSAVGIDDAYIHIIVGTTAGVTFPLLLIWFCRRINFPWLFKAPKFLTGEAKTVVLTQDARGTLSS
jgi:fucose 4-O-acetylase-like acetyltransferase